MKLFRNIQIFLWVMMPMVLMAQEMSIDWAMPLSKENTSQEVQIGPPVPGFGDTLYRNYIPYSYKNPLEVNINLIFFQKSNGRGGFQEDNMEHQRLWDDVTTGVNKLYASVKDSDLDSCFAWRDPFLSDTRIRFKFNRYYIKNDSLWNRNNYIASSDLVSQVAASVGTLAINVYFRENSDLFDEYMDVIAFGDTSSLKDANYACEYPCLGLPCIDMPDMYCKFLWAKYIWPRIAALEGHHATWEDPLRSILINSVVTLFAHELGHALNLDHWCNHYGENYCRDALMTPSGASGYRHIYIPPTEIGKMHKALSEERLKELISCDISSAGTMTITHNLNWNGPFRCYADLNIATSGRLTMQGQVQMPPKSTIETSGHLYIRNGNIACVNANELWQGIWVKQDGLLWLENTTIKDFDIIMETGSTLVLAGNIRFENGHKVILSNGVYVCAASNLAVSGTVPKPFYTDGIAHTATIAGLALGMYPLYETDCSPQGRVFFLQKCTEIPETLYIQKEQINQDMTYVGKTIMVGNSVDPNSSRLKGDVVVNAPARVKFVYKNRLVLDKGFRCNSGSSYRGLKF